MLTTGEAAKAYLATGKPLSSSGLDLEPIRELGLLTSKPFIYVFNIDEAVLQDDVKLAELAALVAPVDVLLARRFARAGGAGGRYRGGLPAGAAAVDPRRQR